MIFIIALLSAFQQPKLTDAQFGEQPSHSPSVPGGSTCLSDGCPDGYFCATTDSNNDTATCVSQEHYTCASGVCKLEGFFCNASRSDACFINSCATDECPADVGLTCIPTAEACAFELCSDFGKCNDPRLSCQQIFPLKSYCVQIRNSSPTPSSMPKSSPTPGSTPNSSPTPSPTSDDVIEIGRVCFPSESTVELQSGIIIPMKAVSIGNRIRVSDTLFSEVFMFTHRIHDALTPFVTISTVDSKSISLTHGHYIYANGKLVAACTVREGDYVENAKGENVQVTRVKTSRKKGLYNPQTIHGDIVVDGIRASTYTTSVHHFCAHALLAPLRALYTVIGFGTALFNHPTPHLTKIAPQGPQTAQ